MVKFLSFVALVFLFSVGAYAQVVEPFPIPDVDPLAQLLLLVANWKAMGPLALGMGLVVLSVQILKRFAAGFKYSRVAVTMLSVLYGVLLSVQSGMSFMNACLAVVITGGGAVAIYEAWKGISKSLEGAK
jgi:hypothetical protein